MDQQIKEYSDDINLYDLWQVIAKRKKFIIGLFLVVVISTAVLNALMPKIYRGEAAIGICRNETASMSTIAAKEVIPSREIISEREIAEILGNLDSEKRINILPKTHASVTDIKLRPVRESKDKFIIVIEAKNVDDIPKALSELLDYINNFSVVKLAVNEEREKLLSRVAELSEIVQSSSNLADRYHQLLKTGKLVAVGFNPIDLDIKLADVKLEKLAVEQALQRIQEGCIASAAQVYVSPNPVKPKRMMNVALAGTLSLCAGIALAFLLEYRRKD